MLSERFVYEICNESITPPVHFRSFRMQLPDATGHLRSVLNVEIPRSLFVHRSPGGYFFRQGSSKREMPPDYLIRLSQQLSQDSADSIRGTTGTAIGYRRFVARSSGQTTRRDLSESEDVVLFKRGLLSKEERRL